MFGLISAGFWFYASLSISVEKEREHRLKRAKDDDIGGFVEILDNDKSFELIGTLRHQARWGKWGAFFAALAVMAQALDNLI
jgi:hypothetical protein